MPDISTILKQEIARVARKEVRAELAPLQKVSAGQRRAITELRRQVASLEQQLKRLTRGAARSESLPEEREEAGHSLRWSAKGFAAHRRRLDLSAAAVAQILGVSPLSVYKWESGSTRPRAKQLDAIAELRSMGRREALARLEAGSENSPPVSARRRA